MAPDAGIDPAQLAELAAEYRRWHRAAAAYRDACDKPNAHTMTELLLRESTAAANLLKAASNPTTTTPAGCSRRKTEADFKEAGMTERFENLAIQGVCELAVKTDGRSEDSPRPVAVAMEVAEIMAELKSRASDREDWRYWHEKFLPWAPSRSDWLVRLYRSLPEVRHGEALKILAAPDLMQAGWLFDGMDDLHRLPELRPGKLLRCVAGGGSTLFEAVPAGPPEGLYHVTICEYVTSAGARRLRCADPQNWHDVCEELRITLHYCDPDSVQLIEADAETAILTPQPETAAAN